MTLTLSKVFHTWEDPDGFVYVEAVPPYRAKASILRLTTTEFNRLLETGKVTI